jgi:hypothetical protein
MPASPVKTPKIIDIPENAVAISNDFTNPILSITGPSSSLASIKQKKKAVRTTEPKVNENPYDLLPVAGDLYYYCVIQAEKAVSEL